MRNILQRSWNWIPHSEAVINSYLGMLDSKIYECTIHYLPHDLLISVHTDHEILLQNLDDHFIADGSLFVMSGKNKVDSHIKLIYLVNIPAVAYQCLNVPAHTLSSTYARTDVAFDPSRYIALMHGPAKFGFVKSLILGLVSYYLAPKGLHGLHSSLVSQGNQGILFAGVHGAGKSSMAYIYALTEPDAALLSDDWVLCENRDSHLLAMPLEMNAYLDPEVVKRILEAVPLSETVNKELRSRLEFFIRQADKPEAKQLMGADQRMYLRDYSRHNTHEPVLVNKLVAFELEKFNRGASRSFVNLLIDCSYHIPFHSKISRETLCSLECFDCSDRQTNELIEFIHARQDDEQKFWLEIVRVNDEIIFDTSDEDLWGQYLRLREIF